MQTIAATYHPNQHYLKEIYTWLHLSPFNKVSITRVRMWPLYMITWIVCTALLRSTTLPKSGTLPIYYAITLYVATLEKFSQRVHAFASVIASSYENKNSTKART